MRSRSGRLFGALALAVAVAFIATGCSASGARAQLAGAPRVGDCWGVNYADSQKYEDWEGSASVPCATPHELYTFAVARIGKTFTGSWLTAQNSVRTDVDDAAYAACVRQSAIDLPGLQTLGLLRVNYYLPSVALWNSGARWVRCDISEIKIGSSVASPTLEDLPTRFATLTESLNTDPKKFDRCEDDVLNNGPDGAETTYADCTGPTDWSFALALTLAGAKGAAYPGVAALKALGAKDCASEVSANGHDLFAEIPTTTSWTTFDDRELDCWVNNN
jgi:hypothetical protein